MKGEEIFFAFLTGFIYMNHFTIIYTAALQSLMPFFWFLVLTQKFILELEHFSFL